MFVPRRLFCISAITRGRKPFFIRFTTVGDEDEAAESMESVRAFKQHFAQYLFRHPVTNTLEDPKTLAKTFDPSVTYIAYHPTLRAYDKGVTHSQIADRAFEERAIQAVERHLMANHVISRWQAVNPKREEGWRYLTGEHDVAEWDGIWRREDGHIFFFETKHPMSMTKFPNIREKFNKSTSFLQIPHSSATVFIAGNHWLGDKTMVEAKEFYGFGVVHGNGRDLDVEDPVEHFVVSTSQFFHSLLKEMQVKYKKSQAELDKMVANMDEL